MKKRLEKRLEKTREFRLYLCMGYPLSSSEGRIAGWISRL